MKTYQGKRTDQGCVVTVDGRPLPLPSDLSGATTGFDWGYVGNGQLSLALLSDLLGDPRRAKVLYPAFERAVVAELPRDEWVATDEELAGAIVGLRDSDANANREKLPAGSTSLRQEGSVGFGDMPVRTGDLIAPQQAEQPGAQGRMS
jgi:hypothetical protein